VCLALTDAGIPDLFASYSRPGGNVTGMAQSVEGVTGKLVEVALEIVPGARRIGFLSNPRGASMPLFAESVDVAARTRGIAVLTEEVATGGELASAFDRFGKQGAQARHRAGKRSVLFAGYADRAARARRAAADRRRRTPIYRGRLACILRHRPTRELSAWGQLCRPDSQGRQARGFADRVPDQDRADDQSQDSQGAGPRPAPIAGHPRRRGDGMSNCVVGSGGSRLPCSTIAEHRVEGCDHFSHDGDDDDLGFFVGVGEAIVEGFEGGTVSARAEGGHVEDITDRHPTTVDAAVSL